MATERPKKAIPAPPLLLASIRVLMWIGVLALYFTREVPVFYVAVFGVLFVMGLYVHASPRLLSFAAKAQTVLSLVAFIWAVFDFRRLSGSFLLAVAHFLIFIQAIRLLSLQSTRDNLGSLLLSSLMMISASTLSVDWTFLVILILFVPSVIWALMVHNLSMETEEVIIHANEARVSSFSLKRPAWLKTLKPLRRSAFIALSVTVVCCALVFIIFPRFNFQGFRGQFLQPVAKTGMSNQVNLNQQSTIFQDSTIVMRIQLDPRDMNRWPGYVRGRTLSAFDGANWAKSALQNDVAIYGVGGQYHIGNVPHKDALPQKIYLESMDTSTLYAAGRPFKIKIERPALFMSPDGSFRRAGNDTWRIYYEVQASVADSFYALPLSDKELEANLVLGPLADNAQIKSYVSKLRRPDMTPLKLARTIESNLQNNYKYSLEGKSIPKDENPIVDFLFNKKQGHCEFFASAMAVMLRTEGIPARIVTGFLSREKNRRGNYIVVRSLHAHAWVEGYIPGEGWVFFDPTPPSREEFVAQRNRFSEWSEMMDNLNLKWNRYVMSYDMDRQVDIFMAFNRRSQKISLKFDWSFLRKGASKDKERAGQRASSIHVPAYVLLGSIVLLLATLLYLRIRRRDLSQRIYDGLLKLFSAYSAERSRQKTLQERFDEAKQSLGDVRADAEQLLRHYYEMRFNPDYSLAPDHRRQLVSVLNRITRSGRTAQG